MKSKLFNQVTLSLTAFFIVVSPAYSAFYQIIGDTSPQTQINYVPGHSLSGAHFYSGSNLEPFESYVFADLSFADLSNADLSGADLRFANLSNVDLSGASLSGADLAGIRSGGIIGVPAFLPASWKLINGYLIGPSADLSGADLSGANLSNVDLSGASLSGADLTGIRSGGIIGVPMFLPASWQLINGYLIGPSADLSGADLSGADLESANLSGANLYRVKSGAITGTTSSLPANWQLTNSYLIGPGADLSDADLRDADLIGTDLIDADLIDADLSDVDLSGADLNFADLSGVKSGGITGTTGSLPASWQLTNGYLIGPGANLVGADLSGADLSDADLSDADLSDADLSGVKSGGITGTTSSLPASWQLTNGYLIGPGANLVGADLSGADLSDADLSGADLTDVIGNQLIEWLNTAQAELAAAVAQLADEYTLTEIADLRPGSAMIAVTGESTTLSMKIEESINLVDWTDSEETADAILPAPSGKKFFRISFTD